MQLGAMARRPGSQHDGVRQSDAPDRTLQIDGRIPPLDPQRTEGVQRGRRCWPSSWYSCSERTCKAWALQSAIPAAAARAAATVVKVGTLCTLAARRM